MAEKVCIEEARKGIGLGSTSRIPLVGAGAAVLFGISLFAIDALGIGTFELHVIVEALALVFIGISFMTLCFTACRGMDRYHWRMAMGITFCLWGLEAVLPEGLPRLMVRDIVVLLFILDLVLMILDWSPKGVKGPEGRIA